MNEIDRIKKIVIQFQEMIINAATGTSIHPAEYERLRNNILSEPLIRNHIPEFVISCRDLKRYWAFIKKQSPNYQGRRDFIWKKLDPILTYLENDSFEPIGIEIQDVLAELNIPAISGIWKKALERKNYDPDGAITSAKSLLETVCKYILDEHGEIYSTSDDMPKLYKKITKILKIDPDPKIDQILLKIFSGCISVVNGVADLRNKFGDAHGKGKKDKRSDEKFASLAIGLAGTMTIFLVKSHLENLKKEHQP